MKITWFGSVGGRLAALLAMGWLAAGAAGGETLTLHPRSRNEVIPGGGDWRAVERTVQWEPRKTALVICDMWNEHWCKGATARVAEMAPRMNQVVEEARRRGVFIIHCPSDTMKYYAGTPQRQLAVAAPKVTPRLPLQNWVGLDSAREGKLPIDDSDGGCDDEPQCATGGPWRHQIDALRIAEGDAITDSAEAYYLMEQRGIENVIVMGVHGNMCVLGRPFAVRQMVGQGKRVLLMRDMIDTMYNSRKAPYVSHFAGTDLIVEHMERYWCASITSTDFLGGEPFHFAADTRPHVVFIIGENEYHTWETLPEFAGSELDWRGFRCSFVMASPDVKDNVFTNYAAIREADVLVLSARRRTPPKEMLALIRAHLAAGKPLVGLRTASHAFGAEPADDAHEGWNNFDVEVLGGNYLGHYRNGEPSGADTVVRLGGNPPAEGAAVLTGVGTNSFISHGSLYKYKNLAPTVTPLATGQVTGAPEIEPVAWLNTGAGRRVFYTSLGAPGDFQEVRFRRLLFNGICWALQRPIPANWVPRPAGPTGKVAMTPAAPSAPVGTGTNGLAPAEALKTFTVPDDLAWDQVLAEPAVRQPVFMNFDERGRLWVVEYLQYPQPAGLKLLSRDSVWRAVYDRVPPPPPHHFPGADRISIYEDVNRNGRFEKHTVFRDGLNIVTSVVRGRGGVWVLNPPYLLFYADRNNDDIPDGDPEVRLAGFGLEDTHSVVNSLRWGPDGWLYGCQGSTVTAAVLRPGQDEAPIARTMGQQIWRYHPEYREFEVFAEGGGNAFGCEIDAQGRVFSGHNGGNTRGFHYQQGAYLQKGFEKHGPLSNPYAFGYFPPMAHAAVERFTHNFIIYDGGALPAPYQGNLFGVEPLQGRVVRSQITPVGDTFQTVDLDHPVITTDRSFRPVDIKVGPDGAMYVADWYDPQIAHERNEATGVDKSNGRIYRLRARNAPAAPAFDLARFSGTELIQLLGHTNKWFRQEALRVLGDRRDASLIPALRGLVRDNPGQLALEALWALNLSGGLDDGTAGETLEHANPQVRLWTARLLGDRRFVPALAGKLVELAGREPEIEVRAQLASTAKRLLPAGAGLALTRALAARSEDAADPRIPLLLWWAIETHCETQRVAVVDLFRDPAFWRLPLVRDHLLSRTMRRFAQPGTRRDWLVCAELLRLSPSAETTARLVSGFEEALKGRSQIALPDELLTALAAAGANSVELGVRRGDATAVAGALQTVADRTAPVEQRRHFLELLGAGRPPGALPVLLNLVTDPGAPELLPAVFAGLRAQDDPAVAETVLAHWSAWAPVNRGAALELLASRAPWVRALLAAAATQKIPAAEVSSEAVRRLRLFADPAIADAVNRAWGKPDISPSGELQEHARQFADVIRRGAGDPYAGRTLFTATCGACHQLYGLGGRIGPDLTPYPRSDLDTLLPNIVNPSAQIREGYENYLVTTRDGRSLSGFLADSDRQVIVLRGLDGADQVLPRTELLEFKTTGVSLMPEGLLEALNENQLRDLFAYLRSSQPLVGSPPKP